MNSTGTPRVVTFIRVPAVSDERTAAYEQWYDSTHIPLRMEKPGFLGAQRYETLVGKQRYFVVYELADVTAPEGEAYTKLRQWEASQSADSFEAPALSRPGFERGIYEQVSGPAWPAPELKAPIVHVAGHHPHDSNDVFADWLRNTYVADLASVEGVAAVRHLVHTRHEYAPGTGMLTPYPRCITISYLDSPEILDNPAFKRTQDAAVKRDDDPAPTPYVIVGRLVFTATGQPV
ncbi:MAG: hypothetical protein EOO27_14690 [Comamonadaceae bacterium]|nr:MAG: hypothetical protein EOO27_14690 [Comamonadaceae bacterium]